MISAVILFVPPHNAKSRQIEHSSIETIPAAWVLLVYRSLAHKRRRWWSAGGTDGGGMIPPSILPPKPR
jgi:hypothetical protein